VTKWGNNISEGVFIAAIIHLGIPYGKREEIYDRTASVWVGLSVCSERLQRDLLMWEYRHFPYPSRRFLEMEIYLSERQVSAVTGVRLSTLRSWRSQRRGLKYRKNDNGAICYDTEDVIRLIEERGVDPTNPKKGRYPAHLGKS